MKYSTVILFSAETHSPHLDCLLFNFCLPIVMNFMRLISFLYDILSVADNKS